MREQTPSDSARHTTVDGNLVPSAERIVLFVRTGSGDVADQLCWLLPTQVLSRSEARGYLAASAPSMRWLGLARVLVELAYAVDPYAADSLAEVLLPIATGPMFESCGIGPVLGRQIHSNLVAAAARAALQAGKFERALSIIVEPLAELASDDTSEVRGWLDDVRYEALIRTFRFDEAWQVRRERKAGIAPLSSRAAELDQMLDVFAPDPDTQIIVEPALPFSWSKETKTLMAEWLPSQRKANAELMTSFVDLPLDPDERAALHRHFAEADDALESIERAVVLDDAAGNDRDDILHRGLFRLQTALRSIQGSLTERPVTLEDNRHRLNFAAMITGLKRPSETELEEALVAATAAVEWSARVGDQHGEIMALWTRGLLQDRRNVKEDALRAFEAVFRRLVSLRSAGLTSAQARSLLAVTFRTLIPRLADLAVQFENHELAFEALEFRRGIVIVETDLRRNSMAKADPPPGIHYFAVSVFEEHGVFAALRTADGAYKVQRIDLELERLNVLVTRIDPETWPKRGFRTALSPRVELAALMQLLEHALASGAIRQNDHVTVALDHPLHTVPIHYLELDGALAVECLSFSRVASYEDMRRIAAADSSLINTIAAVFIPPSDATDREGDRKAFQASIAPILSHVDARLEGEAADRDAVLDLLRASDLVHLHAHGYFPEVSPDTTVDTIREAGILVATERHLPSRSHSKKSLLRPRDLLDATGIAAKHVSLAACVSGLGRPGRGGDMLGLEFAFRLRGVESVIASHWHVETKLAAEFYAAYYQFWLIDGRPKAEAWRNATLKLIDERPGGSIDEACAKCAFSLFGDWR